jgi:hypothetical protein
MSLNVLPIPVDEATLQARHKTLDTLEAQLAGSVQWQECESAAAYRKMRREGLNGFQAPALNPNARTVNISGRDGYQIELRIIAPKDKPSRGVWLHFHAGKEPICRQDFISLSTDSGNWQVASLLVAMPRTTRI